MISNILLIYTKIWDSELNYFSIKERGSIMHAKLCVFLSLFILLSQASAQDVSLLPPFHPEHPNEIDLRENSNQTSLPDELANTEDFQLLGFTSETYEALDVEVVGQYAYVAAFYEGFYVVDISDSSNPTVIGHCATPDRAWDVAIDGNYAFVADQGSGLQVINISNPENPFIEGSSGLPTNAFGVAIHNGFAYVADWVNGIRVLDISNPTQPTEVDSGNISFGFGEARDIAFYGDIAFVAMGSAGLAAFDVSDPYDITYHSTRYVEGQARDVKIMGDYAYVASDGYGLHIVAIVNTKYPEVVSEVRTNQGGFDLALTNDYALMASRHGGTSVIDIRDITNPVEVGVYDCPGFDYGVDFDNGKVYIASYTGGLTILNLTGFPSLNDRVFTPAWSGNPYQPMNINILETNINGSAIDIGDEIGIFDDTLCVGTYKHNQFYDGPIIIKAGMDDITTAEVDGFRTENPIKIKLWDFDKEELIEDVHFDVLVGTDYFMPLTSNTLVIESSYSIQTISLTEGWNIISFNKELEDNTLFEIIEPLIDQNKLRIAFDEEGSTIFYNSVYNQWIDNIGTWYEQEGYYVNVADDAILSVFGEPFLSERDIHLTKGWNIMGYPLQNPQYALSAFDSLIASGKLVRVIDEKGNTIEYVEEEEMWIDNILFLKPGEGYLIKVTENAIFTLRDNNDVAKNRSPERNAGTEYFEKSFSGNPFNPMNIFIKGDLPEETLEIAAFADEICIGASIAEKILINGNNYYRIVATSDDPMTQIKDGFYNSDSIKIKYWNGTDVKEVGIATLNASQLLTYRDRESTFISIANPNSIKDEPPFDYFLNQNYPNPFNPVTTIHYALAKSGNVTISVFNVLGEMVATLVDEVKTVGHYEVQWNATGQTSGMYFCRMECGDFSETKKMILLK